MADHGDKVTEKELSKLTFHFTKSNFFRVMHVDGAWGGVDGRGQVQMTIHSERLAIPTDVTHSVTKSRLGLEILSERKTREGYVRELEGQLVMTQDTAKEIAAWLLEKLALAAKLKENSKELTEVDDEGDSASH